MIERWFLERKTMAASWTLKYWAAGNLAWFRSAHSTRQQASFVHVSLCTPYLIPLFAVLSSQSSGFSSPVGEAAAPSLPSRKGLVQRQGSSPGLTQHPPLLGSAWWALREILADSSACHIFWETRSSSLSQACCGSQHCFRFSWLLVSVLPGCSGDVSVLFGNGEGEVHTKKWCFLFLMIFCCFPHCSHTGIFQHGRGQVVSHEGDWVVCCNRLWPYRKLYPLVQIPGGSCTPTPSLLRCLQLKGCVGLRNQWREIPCLQRHREELHVCSLQLARKWFWHLLLCCLGEAHWFRLPLHCTGNFACGCQNSPDTQDRPAPVSLPAPNSFYSEWREILSSTPSPSHCHLPPPLSSCCLLFSQQRFFLKAGLHLKASGKQLVGIIFF